MVQEIWKVIPGFDDYRVSNLGQVKSSKRKNPIILKPGISNGYPYVNLTVNGKQILRRVHRLVLFAFIGPCPDGMEACHNNDIKDDNRLENLRYDTRKNNLRDSVKNNGGIMKQAKLTLKQVEKIKKLLLHRPLQEIADEFSVSISTISAIKDGKTFKYIEGELPVLSSFQKNKDRAIEIRKLYSTGEYKYKDLANMFGITISGISRIINHQRASDENAVYPIRDKEGKFLANTKPIHLKIELWERLDKAVKNKRIIPFIVSELIEMWLDKDIKLTINPIEKEK